MFGQKQHNNQEFSLMSSRLVMHDIYHYYLAVVLASTPLFLLCVDCYPDIYVTTLISTYSLRTKIFAFSE